MLWLGESMTALQLAGCGLIFAAMLVNRWPALRSWLRSSSARHQPRPED
jgi:hypothetical protein